MKYPSISSQSRIKSARVINCKNRASGITLLEIILVVAIISITASLGLFTGAGSYQKNTFRSSRDILVSALQHSRAQAINNICLGTGCASGKPHGIHINIDSDRLVKNYAIFQGEIYDPNDPSNVIIDISEKASKNILLTEGSAENIYFEQISGDSYPSAIMLSSGMENSTININSEGAITWTN